ncbi:T9SS type B sorting domain-containing protein [Flavobacterium sp. WC2429]|uniref:T9SS type B sorting domain-containing protein n=2 Tax=unclassified Flavobacterium TaxID=196869 RepID=A0AB39WGD6_9FLAO
MKNSIRLFASLFIIIFLSSSIIHVHASVSFSDLKERIYLIAPPPTVNTPINLCQNSAASPLTATSSPGGTLIWYGTNAIGGVGSASAPTPSTTTVGQTKYYVSQNDGTGESTRAEIVVNVVADNGAAILSFRCDPTQATTTTSVFFDWANNPLISNTYNYSYTINGGPTVSGTTGVSHQEVFGVSPGESATLTLSSATHPCVPPQTLTCTVPCGASTITPNFPAIAPFCFGSVAPILGPTSPNNITGTWLPAVISNTTSGSYVFTPNPVLFPCATTQALNVTVTPLITPTFSGIPATVCQNAIAPVLPSNSNNVPSISGTWSPATVDTSILGPVTYTFTPNPGQCTSVTSTMVTITIVQNVTPDFASIAPFCSGTTAPILTSTSPNGIVGSWMPATIDNTTSGSYVFTPNPNQCASSQTLNVSIIQKATPDFQPISPICTGTATPVLNNTAPNGITGTWSPATIDNTASGSYVFTPNSNQCANTQTLNVVITALINPGFASFSVCSGSIPPTLNQTSPNGITGTWSPGIVDNMTSASYDFIPDPNQCASAQTIDVTVIPSNTLVDFTWTVTEAFAENQVITISATAAGNYSYMLDSGPLQDSPIFEYVSSGYHSVTVIDQGGCSNPITKSNILVINYSKYFTPNGDSYNDTWNIAELQDELGSKIFIFDRYGKLLKEIRPNGNGWDGNYNGQPMPSNDYWFVVEYTEQNISKKFKSHFSLKR